MKHALGDLGLPNPLLAMSIFGTSTQLKAMTGPARSNMVHPKEKNRYEKHQKGPCLKLTLEWILSRRWTMNLIPLASWLVPRAKDSRDADQCPARRQPTPRRRRRSALKFTTRITFFTSIPGRKMIDILPRIGVGNPFFRGFEKDGQKETNHLDGIPNFENHPN